MTQYLKITHYVAVAILIAFSLADSAIATDQSLVSKTHAYGEKLAAFENSSETISIRQLIDEGQSLAKEILLVIYALSDKEFEEIQANMKGFHVQRSEIYVVEVDPFFFSQLAEKNGNTEDKLYFAFLESYYTNSIWPNYIMQQTDLGGCIKFGDKQLSDLYSTANQIITKVSGSYRTKITSLIKDIETALTSSTCACENQKSVVDELQYFLEVNQGSDIEQEVLSRLSAIESDNSGMRYNCLGGI